MREQAIHVDAAKRSGLGDELVGKLVAKENERAKKKVAAQALLQEQALEKEVEAHIKLLQDLLYHYCLKKTTKTCCLDAVVGALTTSNHKQNMFITDVKKGIESLAQIFEWIKMKKVGD